MNPLDQRTLGVAAAIVRHRTAIYSPDAVAWQAGHASRFAELVSDVMHSRANSKAYKTAMRNVRNIIREDTASQAIKA